MKAYQNIRFIESPDVADIREQGRKSSIGRFKRGDSFTHYVGNQISQPINKTKHNDRGYCAPTSKAATRRHLKRRDRAISAKFDSLANG